MVLEEFGEGRPLPEGLVASPQVMALRLKEPPEIGAARCSTKRIPTPDSHPVALGSVSLRAMYSNGATRRKTAAEVLMMSFSAAAMTTGNPLLPLRMKLLRSSMPFPVPAGSRRSTQPSG